MVWRKVERTVSNYSIKRVIEKYMKNDLKLEEVYSILVPKIPEDLKYHGLWTNSVEIVDIFIALHSGKDKTDPEALKLYNKFIDIVVSIYYGYDLYLYNISEQLFEAQNYLHDFDFVNDFYKGHPEIKYDIHGRFMTLLHKGSRYYSIQSVFEQSPHETEDNVDIYFNGFESSYYSFGGLISLSNYTKRQKIDSLCMSIKFLCSRIDDESDYMTTTNRKILKDFFNKAEQYFPEQLDIAIQSL